MDAKQMSNYLLAILMDRLEQFDGATEAPFTLYKAGTDIYIELLGEEFRISVQKLNDEGDTT